jgi:hypothetical protein
MQLRNGKQILFNIQENIPDDNHEVVLVIEELAPVAQELVPVAQELVPVAEELAPHLDKELESVKDEDELLDDDYDSDEELSAKVHPNENLSEEINGAINARNNLVGTLTHLNKRLNREIVEIYELAKIYHKFRKSKKIRDLGKDVVLELSLDLANQVVDHGNQLITSLTCWFVEKDILNGLRFHFPMEAIGYHSHLLKIIYILDKIREKYSNNLEMRKKTEEVVKKYLDLLTSFGPHILWCKN